ncbi:MAG: ATP phosphoribosyltransferase regulatory subunit [Clostridia bacterium]|nr:ATP phosphoribosyltransferase regulatory subunit [Clostridia bacterium]
MSCMPYYATDENTALIPSEPAIRRRVESGVASLLAALGHTEVAIPTMQSYDPEAPAPIREMMDAGYKLVGPGAEVVVLRHDLTEAAAAIAQGELASSPRPLKLFYSGTVFRPPHPAEWSIATSPWERGAIETQQLGAEIFGGQGRSTDVAAAVALARCLSITGISDFQIRIGHMGALEAVTDVLELNVPGKVQLGSALLRHDMVAVSRMIAASSVHGSDCELIRNMLFFPSGDSALADAHALARLDQSGRLHEAIRDIHAVLAGLACCDMRDHAVVDLGLVRRLAYYTGTVFEAFTPGCPAPIAGGGRYDGLLRLMGSSEPAVGFAVELDRIVGICTKATAQSRNGGMSR